MLSDRAKSELYHELATLSRAGLPIHTAAEAALDERRPRGERVFLEDLKRGVIEGNTLSEAAAQSAVDLTDLEIAVLNACEEGGKVPEAFSHLSRYFGMCDRARKRIKKGLVYPAVLLHAAVLLPALVTAVQTQKPVAAFLKAGLILLVIYAVVGFGILFFNALSERARTNAPVDRLLRKVPFVGKARHAFALSRFAEILRIQLVTGRGPMRGIRFAADASGSGSLMKSVRKHVLPEVENGRRAGPGFRADRGRNFPGAFARSYAAAEEAGDSDDEMARWSDAFAGQAEDAIDRLARGIPKVVYTCAAAYAIYAIYQMYSAYLGRIIEVMDQF
jgi:type IV pilus assembly protein PilC